MGGATEAPEPLRPRLLAVADKLGAPLNERQCDQLLAYLDLLQRWNATYNLTAVREPAQMLTLHLADCLAVIAPLRRQWPSATARVLDVGSGGGLPGVVLAVMHPAMDITCVDSVGKKAAFVQQVAGELTLRNLRATHARVENLDAGSFDIVTSRAFASLAQFTKLTRRCMAANGIWMAMKGKIAKEELREAEQAVTVFHVEQLRVPGLDDAARSLVWMR